MILIRTHFLLLLSMVLFITSLTQEAYYIDRENYDAWADSFGLFWMGWLGVFAGGAGFSWLANPLLITSWIVSFSNAHKKAAIFSFLAVIASGSFLFFDTIVSSEAPTFSIITERKAGYWLWLSSCIMMAAYSIYQLSTNQKREMVKNDAHSAEA